MVVLTHLVQTDQTQLLDHMHRTMGNRSSASSTRDLAGHLQSDLDDLERVRNELHGLAIWSHASFHRNGISTHHLTSTGRSTSNNLRQQGDASRLWICRLFPHKLYEEDQLCPTPSHRGLFQGPNVAHRSR